MITEEGRRVRKGDGAGIPIVATMEDGNLERLALSVCFGHPQLTWFMGRFRGLLRSATWEDDAQGKEGSQKDRARNRFHGGANIAKPV